MVQRIVEIEGCSDEQTLKGESISLPSPVSKKRNDLGQNTKDRNSCDLNTQLFMKPKYIVEESDPTENLKIEKKCAQKGIGRIKEKFIDH